MTTYELFRKHAPFVARLLHRLGVPARELDDVVQQVFVVVHENGGYVLGPATPASYLGAIAVKAASSARRRAGAQRSRHTEYSPELLASAGRDPVTVLEVRRELMQLQAALDEMDPGLRTSCELCQTHDIRSSERLGNEWCIAVRTDVGTVARERCRGELFDMGGSRRRTRISALPMLSIQAVLRSPRGDDGRSSLVVGPDLQY